MGEVTLFFSHGSHVVYARGAKVILAASTHISLGTRHSQLLAFPPGPMPGLPHEGTGQFPMSAFGETCGRRQNK